MTTCDPIPRRGGHARPHADDGASRGTVERISASSPVRVHTPAGAAHRRLHDLTRYWSGARRQFVAFPSRIGLPKWRSSLIEFRTVIALFEGGLS